MFSVIHLTFLGAITDSPAVTQDNCCLPGTGDTSVEQVPMVQKECAL